MTDRRQQRRRSLEDRLRSHIRDAGSRYERWRHSSDGQLEAARDAYRAARNATALPEDEKGRVRIVCRRYAERRARHLDEEYRPTCFEAEHPDCEGCVEDVREGRIETW